MGGGLMQLVAYGAQDIYLTGNPQITFFKVVYRRHTNFSMESIQQTFNGTADFGGSVSATISRNGDLVHRMYLEHDASYTTITAGNDDSLAIRCDYGSHLMKEVELEIGGQRIDRHYGHWHSVYSQLTESNPSGLQSTLFNKMSGNGKGVSSDVNLAGNTQTGTETFPNGFTLKSETGTSALDTATAKLFIPLYFWFCRNPGLALPLIALQYHEVKVKITFEELGNLVAYDEGATFGNGTEVKAVAGNVTSKDFNLWVDYIYLDTDERRRFAQVSHEYLIEQLQYESKTGGGTMDLNFNHPVKELIWSGTTGTVFEAITADELYDRNEIGTGTYQLKLNGHDRFKERDVKYFTRTQVWEHHSGYGCTEVGDTIAVYSFALKPEEHQPSGTCNFSRIDNAQLVDSTTADINVYAVNYNVLRIMSGMGGLAYSN
jgi:hypothetical protein